MAEKERGSQTWYFDNFSSLPLDDGKPAVVSCGICRIIILILVLNHTKSVDSDQGTTHRGPRQADWNAALQLTFLMCLQMRSTPVVTSRVFVYIILCVCISRCDPWVAHARVRVHAIWCASVHVRMHMLI